MKNFVLATVLIFGVTGIVHANDLFGTWGSPCYNRADGSSYRIRTTFTPEKAFLERTIGFHNKNCEKPGEGKTPKPAVIDLSSGSYSLGEFDTDQGRKQLLRKYYSIRQVIFPSEKEKLSAQLQKDFKDFGEVKESLLSDEELQVYINGEAHFVYEINLEMIKRASDKYRGSDDLKLEYNQFLRNKNKIGYPLYIEYVISDGVMTEFDGAVPKQKGKM